MEVEIANTLLSDGPVLDGAPTTIDVANSMPKDFDAKTNVETGRNYSWNCLNRTTSKDVPNSAEWGNSMRNANRSS